MMRNVLIFLLPLALASAAVARETDAAERYAALAHDFYQQSHDTAVEMQEAIQTLLDEPTQAHFDVAKAAWLEAREPYGRTEVFRFYGGPIDGVGPDAGLPEGVEGAEGRINAWPLNEAYIDYVEGRADAGIVNDPAIDITRETLIGKNATEDEADVTTGWHAIEFLLWGQDFSDQGPGERPVSDYAKSPENERRRDYLRVVTDLLVDDLAFLVEQWTPNRDDNYRARFVELPREEALSKILTGLATLSAFELASERIAVPLDSGDQEDEHSCFSDNTHRDFVANQEGIVRVYQEVVHPEVAAAAPDLDQTLTNHLRQTLERMENLPPPIDRILASAPGSDGRQQMEAVVEALYQQGELLEEVGEALDVEVIIAGE